MLKDARWILGKKKDSLGANILFDALLNNNNAFEIRMLKRSNKSQMYRVFQ